MRYTASINVNDETVMLHWEKGWEQLTLLQNNQIIGSFENKHTLSAGKNIRTLGGATIYPILTKGDLAIWYNGVDLVSGTNSGQANHFKHAYIALYVASAFLVLGFIGFLSSGGGEYIVAALPLVLAGICFSGLAVWAHKTGENLPYKIGLGLTILIVLVIVVLVGRIPSLLLTGALIYYLYKGMNASPFGGLVVNELRENDPLDSPI